MNIEQALIAALGLGFACLGWFAREMWSAVQTLKTELSKLEVKISADFVRYDRMQDAMGPVLEKLTRIEDALHRKVDK
jgi:Flp pilus assembly protein TadB